MQKGAFMNKNEKELINHLSSSLKSNHTFESIKASNVTFKAPKKSPSKMKIALFTGVPTAAVVIGGISLLIVFGFSYKNVRPFENGFFKDFSSFKGFGIGGKKIEKVAKNNRGLMPHRLWTYSYDTYDEPVKFYQLDSDNNYEEAFVYNEKNEILNNYHIGMYQEAHDFIYVSIFNTKGPKIEYAVLYEYDYTSNRLMLDDEYNSTFQDIYGFTYIISKRTGKIYRADIAAPIEGHKFEPGVSRTFCDNNRNFFAYEDGYLVLSSSELTNEDGGIDHNLFLVKEEQEGLKFESILTPKEIDALHSWGGVKGGCESIRVDRYGHIYEEALGTIINGEIQKDADDTYFDPFNNTIYKLIWNEDYENPKYDFYYLNQLDEFVYREQIDKTKKDALMLMRNPRDLHFPTLNRGENYLITPKYKLTFDLSASKDDYRSYEITELPIDLLGFNDWWNYATQGDYLYVLKDERFYKLNCVTLEYDSFKVGGEDIRITEFSVEPNGDIFLKGYSSDI